MLDRKESSGAYYRENYPEKVRELFGRE